MSSSKVTAPVSEFEPLMQMDVKLFSRFREALPREARGEATIELPQGATVATLLDHLDLPSRVKLITVNGQQVADRGTPLHVDLTSGKLEVEEPGEAFFRTYLGGSGLGSVYALKLIPPAHTPTHPGLLKRYRQTMDNRRDTFP